MGGGMGGMGWGGGMGGMGMGGGMGGGWGGGMGGGYGGMDDGYGGYGNMGPRHGKPGGQLGKYLNREANDKNDMYTQYEDFKRGGYRPKSNRGYQGGGGGYG